MKTINSKLEKKIKLSLILAIFIPVAVSAQEANMAMTGGIAPVAVVPMPIQGTPIADVSLENLVPAVQRLQSQELLDLQGNRFSLSPIGMALFHRINSEILAHPGNKVGQNMLTRDISVTDAENPHIQHVGQALLFGDGRWSYELETRKKGKKIGSTWVLTNGSLAGNLRRGRIFKTTKEITRAQDMSDLVKRQIASMIKYFSEDNGGKK